MPPKQKKPLEKRCERARRIIGISDDLKHIREIRLALATACIPSVLIDIIISYNNTINRRKRQAVMAELPYMLYAALDHGTSSHPHNKGNIAYLANRIRPENLFGNPLHHPHSYAILDEDDEVRVYTQEVEPRDSISNIRNQTIFWRKDYARLERARICPQHKGNCNVKSCDNMLQGLANLRRASDSYLSKKCIPLDEDIEGCNQKLATHIGYDRSHIIKSYPLLKNDS